MSFMPLIATMIAIILATSIIDIEAGLLVGLLVALHRHHHRDYPGHVNY